MQLGGVANWCPEASIGGLGYQKIFLIQVGELKQDFGACSFCFHFPFGILAELSTDFL